MVLFFLVLASFYYCNIHVGTCMNKTPFIEPTSNLEYKIELFYVVVFLVRRFLQHYCIFLSKTLFEVVHQFKPYIIILNSQIIYKFIGCHIKNKNNNIKNELTPSRNKYTTFLRYYITIFPSFRINVLVHRIM